MQPTQCPGLRDSWRKFQPAHFCVGGGEVVEMLLVHFFTECTSHNSGLRKRANPGAKACLGHHHRPQLDSARLPAQPWDHRSSGTQTQWHTSIVFVSRRMLQQGNSPSITICLTKKNATKYFIQRLNSERLGPWYVVSSEASSKALLGREPPTM